MSDWHSMTIPSGGIEGRRCLTQPALHVRLMEEVLAAANLRRAWARVKANRGAPGIDGMHIEDFPAFAREQWPTIREHLADGSYCPSPLRRVMIPKPGGGERPLGIATVADRLIRPAIAQVLTPIFDPGFSESSFGFRPKRSAHGALRQVQAHIRAGYRIAVDLDLAKFFDNVRHDILMARAARKVGDKRLLALIGRYLRAGVMVGETFEPSELGTPQGGPLSPLLANILLDDLDRELERRGHRFARYADDLLILVRSQRAGERVKRSITAYLDRRLKLPVNEQKSRVAPIDECVFLGFTFRKGRLRWSEVAFEDFKHQVRKLTGRSWGVSMPTGSTSSRSTCADGWATSASRSTTARSRNSMSGCAGACACATGNSGAGCVPRCATFWHWERADAPRSGPPSAARATGTCRDRSARKPG